jgi:hypothetical protein
MAQYIMCAICFGLKHKRVYKKGGAYIQKNYKHRVHFLLKFCFLLKWYNSCVFVKNKKKNSCISHNKIGNIKLSGISNTLCRYLNILFKRIYVKSNYFL